MYTGGGPASRKAASDGSGANEEEADKKKNPDISICAPHSAGLGMNAGDPLCLVQLHLTTSR